MLELVHITLCFVGSIPIACWPPSSHQSHASSHTTHYLQPRPENQAWHARCHLQITPSSSYFSSQMMIDCLWWAVSCQGMDNHAKSPIPPDLRRRQTNLQLADCLPLARPCSANPVGRTGRNRSHVHVDEGCCLVMAEMENRTDFQTDWEYWRLRGLS